MLGLVVLEYAVDLSWHLFIPLFYATLSTAQNIIVLRSLVQSGVPFRYKSSWRAGLEIDYLTHRTGSPTRRPPNDSGYASDVDRPRKP